ncbi:hypothetical protein WOLCODRAFT_18698 [Wolfiporia cocos MD-104 SS10]|uniref:Uncharacterized protein n=1 Tax=Wolfiporia cocos (strain MD-104) TaxID=742152 RepID=A0A2H3JPC7_WOLCO|nr:hypothetical protein WOLCODRAFT_18698 [Wolfiporia cocos MD-104 SS10]
MWFCANALCELKRKTGDECQEERLGAVIGWGSCQYLWDEVLVGITLRYVALFGELVTSGKCCLNEQMLDETFKHWRGKRPATSRLVSPQRGRAPAGVVYDDEGREGVHGVSYTAHSCGCQQSGWSSSVTDTRVIQSMSHAL